MSDLTQITTLGELKKSGYQSKKVKDELRDNLLGKLKSKEQVFKEIHGYEDTVIPSIERAILAKHNINLLGLRGQAKTKIARLMVHLLDEYIPIVKGSEINDDPFNPISFYAKELILHEGDKTPITWLHREDRYTEKLATPDVSIADLIGDIDPIKAANLKLDYSDERVIHFGLIARANRGIFVINELPDLQARIQVSLFNILQEGDIQIRGFKLRLPLDLQFVFTANPEDYTNRGSIITPLKDRIQSQIMTHYPKNLTLAREITAQEVKLSPLQKELVIVPELLKDLLEQIAFEARKSEYVDAKSGVSARLTIAAYENMVSSAERRCIINEEKITTARVADLMNVVPALVGKIEMVYEGEQEGAVNVAYAIVQAAIRTLVVNYFPELKDLKKNKTIEAEKYNLIINSFSNNVVDIESDYTDQVYQEELTNIPGMKELIESKFKTLPKQEQFLMMEFLLHGLAEYSLLGRKRMETKLRFNDLFQSMLYSNEEENEEDF
ncbi:sigma 54-interacting transcriptional regulator [Acidiluteibacter ferrifornacis]|uniref:Magnesium chelatase n=1 Tax=Acidiluteibacter ferrifornacis TaxID=2692424 RepID=A0A6N9NIC2_9FLAO|nr:sigma 54-interacting transcriptional regulator [Acidiluteibacter ferrifornacis]NBG65653.1 magnesium chelatase [Acidiluteibacter ferrifornacis]